MATEEQLRSIHAVKEKMLLRAFILHKLILGVEEIWSHVAGMLWFISSSIQSMESVAETTDWVLL